jgi:hypothetical protein
MTVSSSASSFRPGVCTSTNRPVSPYEGQVIYETDTDKTKVWNGSSWVSLSSTSEPGSVPNFFVYLSGGNGASVDNAGIAYNTVLYDDLSNVSSGVFTVPTGQAGVYSFSCSGNVYNIGTSGVFRMELSTTNANGIYARGSDAAARGSTDVFSSVSLVAKLPVGATVRAFFRVPQTGNYSAGIAYNWFSGVRIL